MSSPGRIAFYNGRDRKMGLGLIMQNWSGSRLISLPSSAGICNPKRNGSHVVEKEEHGMRRERGWPPSTRVCRGGSTAQSCNPVIGIPANTEMLRG